MKKNIITSAVILTVFAGGIYLIYRQVAGSLAGIPADGINATDSATDTPPNAASETAPLKSGAAPQAIAEIAGYQYTEKYANSSYGFSFKHPQDFAVSELPAEGGEVVLIQNTAKNIGVQILISPFDGGEIDITADFIKAEIPDLKISQPQEVLVSLGRKGLAFMSDNEAFGGASREVWFVFGGNLYQISTYAELDGFLQGLFGTWEFME